MSKIISYSPFWKTLQKKGITQYKLINEFGFSTGTLDSLRKNDSITLNTLEDICKMLDCEMVFIISYEPFWKTLEKKKLSQYILIKDYGFSTGTLDALRKNKSITLNTLHDICMLLDCEIADVVEFKKDNH